jgi:spore cortex formation protein SpoVR/YcgB (stage V sporulation)
MEEVVFNMNTARERLLKIIEKIPDQEVDKILDFAEYLEAKQEKRLSDDLTKASESSLDFWDNDIDDEVWNDV